MTHNRAIVGRRLKMIREARNLSQVDLANLIDRTQAWVSQCERGAANVTYEMQIMIHQLLLVPRDWAVRKEYIIERSEQLSTVAQVALICAKLPEQYQNVMLQWAKKLEESA